MPSLCCFDGAFCPHFCILTALFAPHFFRQIYNIYISLKTSSTEENTELHTAIGQFMEQWILLERLINSISMNKNPNYRTPFSANNLKLIFSPVEFSHIMELRKYRNALVHGMLAPTISNLKQMTDEIKMICDKLQGKLS